MFDAITTTRMVDFVAILGCGSLTGVLLAIGMSFGNFWRSLAPEEFGEWFARRPQGRLAAC